MQTRFIFFLAALCAARHLSICFPRNGTRQPSLYFVADVFPRFAARGSPSIYFFPRNGTRQPFVNFVPFFFLAALRAARNLSIFLLPSSGSFFIY